jgi:hypothetical protein
MLSERDTIAQPERPRTGLAARTGRILRSQWRTVSVIATAVLAATILTTASGQAGATQNQIPLCGNGYICLWTGTTLISIPSGDSITLTSPGLSITKATDSTTSVYYCLWEETSSGTMIYTEFGPGTSENPTANTVAVFQLPKLPQQPSCTPAQ